MEDEILAAERVRVVVRVRPLSNRGLQQDRSNQTVTVDHEKGQVFVCKKNLGREMDRELRYTFDRVFNEKASQVELFNYLRDGVQQVAQGYNCTIFAYGQTGSGKTHTMVGQDFEYYLATLSSDLETCQSCPSSWGVIPRAIKSLFEELQSISKLGSACVVHCSYMQIYNNDVYDLLQDSKKRTKDPLAVREMTKGNDKQVYVSGISEFRVTNVQEALQLLNTGNLNRTIRATKYNEKSSRSHALLQFSIEVESRGLESSTTIIRRAKLNLVDLAGSEKWDSGVVTRSDRSKELTSINQSLSALGNVISALVNSKRSHIPFRNSKLTRLLQDSLGGNTRTVVIATITSSESAVDETISTLQFADRAKCVAVRVKVNEFVDDAILLAQAQREISRLRLLLKQSGSGRQLFMLEGQVRSLSKQNAALVAENQKLRHTIENFQKPSLNQKCEIRERTSWDQITNLANTPTIAPAADRYSLQGVEDQPTYSLKLNKLRFDLEALGAKPVNLDRNNEEFEQAAKEEEALLQEIQAERRELERQFLVVSGERDNQGSDSCSDVSEELCPMCEKNIDYHNDAELDRCIELETKMVISQAKQHLPLSVGEREMKRRPYTQMSQALVHTLRIGSSASDSGLFRAPSTSTHKIPSSNNLQKQSTSSRANVLANDDGVICVSEKRHLKKKMTDNQQHNLSKKNLFRSNGEDSKQADRQASSSQSILTPILRKGHKGLKALKKFRATSPYNYPASCKEKQTALRRVSTIEAIETSHGESNQLVNAVVNSARDIGLELSVYKFRYDCWYNCTIVGFDRKRRMHCCQYECGDKQWQDLSGHKVKIIDRSNDTSIHINSQSSRALLNS